MNFTVFCLAVLALTAAVGTAFADAPVTHFPVAPVWNPEKASLTGGVNVFTGESNGQTWYDARDGGYLDFALPVSPTKPNLLRVTYWGGDDGRQFDVLVDGTKIRTQVLENEVPGDFFTVDSPIPMLLTRGKTRVVVRFQGIGASTAGGVYGAAVGVPAPPEPVVPNPVQSVTRTPNGLRLKLRDGVLHLVVYSPRVVRVYFTNAGSAPPMKSLSIIARPGAQKWNTSETPREITLKTGAIQVHVNRASGAVSFADAKGRVVLTEKAGGRHLKPATVGGVPTLQGRQDFVLPAGEAIFGLGQHQRGDMNYRGRTVRLQQRNMDVAVPVLISSRGYGVFWDNPAITDVRAGSDEAGTLSWRSEAGKAIDYYFLYGRDIDQVIQGYRALTGTVPMFGRWAWGLWQSKERYATQQELLDVVARYREAKIPLDGIIQDWQYWPPETWGSHRFDPARYPDPRKMVQYLHARNTHLLISVWPKFDLETPNTSELRAAGALYPQVSPSYWPVGKNLWYDPFDPTARRIYWRQMKDDLFDISVDGWWLDASEPELGGQWGEFRDYKTGAGPGAEVFNAYPLMHTTAVYKGQRAATSKKRVFILTRSAYAGQQRNASVTWSGDIGASWDVFAKQIPAGINFALTGIPYWNTDTGGFFGNNVKDPNWRELFVRWFQFSTFCPMLRIHGTNDAKEIWRFEGEERKALESFDALRYHLLPYIYSTSWKVTSEGYTMLRGLVMDFRQDTKVYNIPDQFMFGPALMACPVTRAGATARNVYLPSGAAWTDFWTGQTHAGGRSIEASAPLNRMPLFVKAGSILPYGPAVQYSGEKADPLEIRIYPGANGAFTLYEDEGDGYNYEKGAYSTVRFAWDEKSRTLKIGARQGRFPGMLNEHTFRLVLVKPGRGVDVASSATVDRTVSYTGKAASIRF